VTSHKLPLAVYYEHPEWFRPLFAELDRRSIQYVRIGTGCYGYDAAATHHPDWLEWLIIQNTNTYEVGFTAVWDGLRNAYWKNRSVEDCLNTIVSNNTRFYDTEVAVT
jgi:hypothetical protein